MFRSVQYANSSKNLLTLNMQRKRTVANGNAKNQPSSSTFRRRHRTWLFHVVVLQRTAKKCTKSDNAHAEILVCSLNLLFNDVIVAVVVVVCLNSLLSQPRSRALNLSALLSMRCDLGISSRKTDVFFSLWSLLVALVSGQPQLK